MTENIIQDGSMKRLFRISFSLMISFLSMFLMLFVDRLYLSRYSLDALTALSSVGNFFWAGCVTWISLVATAEVFVAQYNGAREYSKLGQAPWQMIHLAGLSFLFFWGMGYFGSQFFYDNGWMNHYEMTYYRWNNYHAPLQIIYTAMTAFYIGQGKTRIIQWLGLLGNGVNACLDPLLIFGFKDWVPSMGIKGAAISTGIGTCVQVVVMVFLFMKAENRLKFGTRQFQWRPDLMRKCLRIGLPPALFTLFELLGWAGFYSMMKMTSQKHTIVCGVIQSLFLLFLFFSIGLEKGVAAIAGNLIGAKKLSEVNRILKSALKLIGIFSLFVAAFMIGMPGTISDLFLNNPTSIHALPLDQLFEVKQSIKFAMYALVIYWMIESIRFVFSGILTSAGDTRFLMIAGVCSIWFFLLVPTYFFVFQPKAPVEIAFYIWIFYSVASAGIYALRFYQGKWKSRQLIEESDQSIDDAALS